MTPKARPNAWAGDLFFKDISGIDMESLHKPKNMV